MKQKFLGYLPYVPNPKIAVRCRDVMQQQRRRRQLNYREQC